MTRIIMIVDDSGDDIEIAKIALEAAGCKLKVKSAFSGEAALRILRIEDKPALILLDLKMPGMSGIEVLQKIREEPQFDEIPVAVVTSSSLPTDEKDAYAAGANAFLLKAVDLEQFCTDIKSLLDRWMLN